MKVSIAIAAALLVALLAGCQTTPEPPKPAPQPVAPVPEPEPVKAAPTVPDGPPPGSPAARTQAQQLLRQAADSLNAGNEDKGRTEVAEALRLDPDSKLAQCLNRGIKADPEQVLGRQSTSYTVRPGETLGRIAQRALGDPCEFYLLARYNNIRVPQQLAGGQVIRIPGRVALAAPDAPAAKPQPDLPAGRAQPVPTIAKPPTEPSAPPSAEPAERAEPVAAPKPAPPAPAPNTRAEIERHQRAALAAFRRQDLDTAIREWDQVIALDPGNELARARRQEAIELDRRIKQIK